MKRVVVRRRPAAPAPALPRWHWGLCVCGTPLRIGEGDLRSGLAGDIGRCCTPPPEGSAAHCHPASHHTARCAACRLRGVR